MNKYKTLGITLTLALLSHVTGLSQQLLIDKVVARVGSETILLSDVEAQYAFAASQQPEAIPENAKCQILESLIGQKLIVHQAKLDSVEVGPDEINAQLDYRINGVLRQMNNDEELFQEYYGMTVDDMRKNLREDLESQLLAERMQAEVLRSIQITPDEVEEFYSQIPQDSLPYLNSEVEFAEIVFKPEVNQEEKDKALNLAIELNERIAGGEDFAELAKTYSADPGSGFRGGDLGFMPRGTFVPEFEEAAYNLDLNEVSDPVETEFGYHLIQMLEKKGTKIHLRHILIKPEITSEDIAKAKMNLDSVKTQLNSGELTFSEAVKKYSIEDIPSYHNDGRVQNPSTGKTFFETAQLPTEVYFAIEDMDVGEVSEVLEYPVPSGEVYYRIVMLQSRTKPHKANLKEDYSKISDLAKQSKKNEYFVEWINEKLSETYIDVDLFMLDGCNNVRAMIESN